MSVSDVMNQKYKEQLQQKEESLIELFQRCKMLFETEDVKAAKGNVELGDHLAFHRALFTHHFICTGFEEDKIILHTVDPICDECSQIPRRIGIKCSRGHKVKTKEYTYQEMEQRNMFKVIWPDELKSRSRDVQDSVSLAKKFKKDMNSERFVTSCIYGVSVELEIKHPFLYMKDVLDTIPALFKNNPKEEYLLKQILAQSQIPHTSLKEGCQRIILTSCTCEGHPQDEGFPSFIEGEESSSFCEFFSFKEEPTKSQIAFSSLQGRFESLNHITEEFLSCGPDLGFLTSEFESFKVEEDISNEIANPDLEAISQMSPHQQRRWLQLIVAKHPFNHEEISETSTLTVGDHIIFQRVRVLGMLRYHHSAIIVEVKDEDNISLIEYSTPDQFKWDMVLTYIAMVKRTTKSLEELINEGAKKVKWPQVLERFTPNEVKKRAESRLKENSYDLIKNNCEHFVAWCKCGLNVSLQVEDWVIMVRTAFYTLVAAIKDHSINGIIQVLANISDDIAVFIKSSSSLPFVVGIVLELLLGFYQTYLLYCLSHNKVIKDEHWNAEIHEIWSKGSCRVIGGCVGSIAGCAFGVMAIGGPIGAGLGHMMIALYQWLRQNSEIRERVDDAISHFQRTTTEEYYSMASLQSFQELFDSGGRSKIDTNSENNTEEWLKPVYLLLQSIGLV